MRWFKHKNLLEAGCDEAGRGCLAGPVFAAAVIWPQKIRIRGLDDSKKLTPGQREILRGQIEAKALAWAVARVDCGVIDEINILQASIRAMHLALEKLEVTPEFILVDGNRFRAFGNIDYSCIIGGDGKFASIAAASILAKTHRDEYMQQLHREHPAYGWDQNKGYGTLKHREAIYKYGLSPYHRRSFRLKPEA